MNLFLKKTIKPKSTFYRKGWILLAIFISFGSLGFSSLAPINNDKTLSPHNLPGDEICNNGIDDDGDGYIDADDPDCIAAGSCGCPPGGVVYNTISAVHTVPEGESHCITGDVTLGSSSGNLEVQGNLYIVNTAHVTVNGPVFFSNSGKIIVCDNASYVQSGFTVAYKDVYNFGWLQITGALTSTENIIMGENSLTALKGGGLDINGSLAYVGNASNSSYLFLDISSDLNDSNGDVCLTGGTPQMIVEVDLSGTNPTCVTDCNGCPEMSGITETPDDGSVETAYQFIQSNATNNTTLEICNNSVDDNGDGRTDEVYPGGVEQAMQLWLKADVGTNTTTSAANVTSWADQSSNGYSANADNNATDFPTFEPADLNYNPGIVFDGTYTDDFSDGLHLGDDYIFSTNEGMHIFAVVNPVDDGGQYNKLFDFGDTQQNGVGFTWSPIATRYNTPVLHGGNSLFFGHNSGVVPSLIEFNIDFGDSMSMHRNGVYLTSDLISLSQITANEIAESNHYGSAANGDHQMGPVSIGRKSGSQFVDQGRIFNGGINEVLIYNDTLSDFEIKKINSYLAMKYGLNLNHGLVSSNGTLLNDITNGYTNNLFTIGRDDCAGLNQKQAGSANLPNFLKITLGNAEFNSNADNTNTFVSDQTFWVIGDNGAPVAPTFNNNNVVSTDGNFTRIDRVWYGQETGEVDQFLMTINADDPQFNLPPPPPESDGIYYLLVDSDGDGNFNSGNPIAYPLTNAYGTTWGGVFTDVSNTHFTFAVQLPPPDEICNNLVDDNMDGRIDEPFPGGVQDNMQLWLKADQGTNTTTQNAAINAWQDQSVNGYSAVADANANAFPNYSQSAVNFNPGINFSGDYTDDFSDGLHLSDDFIFSDNAGMQIFVVVRPDADGEANNYVFDFGNYSGNGYGINYSDTDYGFYSPNIARNNTHSRGAVATLLDMSYVFDTQQTLQTNGTTLDSSSITANELSAANINEIQAYISGGRNGPVSIGRKSSGINLNIDGGQIFNGDIAEIIIYNDLLTLTNKNRINSYLAVKYGLTISHSYYSSSGANLKNINNGYQNNIIGIGRDDCTGLYQKQSKSVEDGGIVTISRGPVANSNQNNSRTIDIDESFFLIGNDGATVDTWTPVIGLAQDYQKINRSWKFDRTNFDQQINITIDVNDPDLNVADVPPGVDYSIILDNDGDYSSGGNLIVPLTNLGGGLWELNDYTPSSFQYFTIAYEDNCSAQAPVLSK